MRHFFYIIIYIRATRTAENKVPSKFTLSFVIIEIPLCLSVLIPQCSSLSVIAPQELHLYLIWSNEPSKLSNTAPKIAATKTISESINVILPKARAIKEINNAATADAEVPRTDIPPLIPAEQGQWRKTSYALPERTPIPDAVVSANASAREATKATTKAFSFVMAKIIAQTDATMLLAKT